MPPLLLILISDISLFTLSAFAIAAIAITAIAAADGFQR